MASNRYTVIRDLIIIGSLFFASPAAYSQVGHEFQLTGEAGWSSLQTDCLNGQSSGAFGFGAGLNYGLYFKPAVSLHFGLSFNQIAGNMTVPTFDGSYNAKDQDDTATPFVFNYDATDYAEKHSAQMISIPLMLQYHFGHKHNFHIGIGAKLAISNQLNYDASSKLLSTYAYYPGIDATITYPKTWGFGNYSNITGAGKIALKTATMLSFELGVRKAFKSGAVYFGLFVDYGVNAFNNEPVRVSDEDVVSTCPLIGQPGTLSKTPEKFYSYRGLTASLNNEGHAYVSKQTPVIAGLRIRIAFSPNGKHVYGEQADTSSKLPPADTSNIAKNASQQTADVKPVDTLQRAAAGTTVVNNNITAPSGQQPWPSQQQGQQPWPPQQQQGQQPWPPQQQQGQQPWPPQQQQGQQPWPSQQQQGQQPWPPQQQGQQPWSPQQQEQHPSRQYGDKDGVDMGYNMSAYDYRSSVVPKSAVGATLDEVHMFELDLYGFHVNSSYIGVHGKAALDKKVQFMKAHPRATCLIEGHTDNTGTDNVNYNLGLERANAVRRYMISKGISTSRIKIVSKAAEMGAGPNRTEAERSRNRRVVFRLE